jgi:hypothetical protein
MADYRMLNWGSDKMASRVCGNCTEPLREGDKFCPSCGAPVDSPQDTNITGKDKKQPVWLIPTLIGAGVVAIIVVIMLWVGTTDVQEVPKKQPEQKLQEAPSEPSEQETSTVEAGGKEEDSQQEESGADEMGFSSMFQAPKKDTGTGKTPEKPGTDEAGSTGEETPPLKPDSEETKTDKETTTPPPEEVDKPGTPEEKRTETFEKAFSEGLEAARSGDFKLASLKFQTAVRLSPDNASAWTNLGLTQRKMGDLQGAVESYRKAIEIKPDFALSHKNLGVALEEMGNLKQAAEAYFKYVELAPEATDATQVKQRAEMLTAKTE